MPGEGTEISPRLSYSEHESLTRNWSDAGQLRIDGGPTPNQQVTSASWLPYITIQQLWELSSFYNNF